MSAAPVRSLSPFQRVPSDRYSTDVRFGDGPDGRRQIGGPPAGAALAHQGAPRPAGAAASLLTGRALDSDLGGDDREQDLLAERADACRYAAPARQVAAMTRARPGPPGTNRRGAPPARSPSRRRTRTRSADRVIQTSPTRSSAQRRRNEQSSRQRRRYSAPACRKSRARGRKGDEAEASSRLRRGGQAGSLSGRWVVGAPSRWRTGRRRATRGRALGSRR